MKLLTKILTVLFLLQLFIACQSGEPAVFILPKDYTGYILVIYGQENGADKEYRDKSRVYRMPPNGVLLSKFPNNPGWSGLPKFYYSSIAPENEIPFILEINNVPEDKVSAFGGSAGFQSRDLEGKEGIRFIEYSVGNRSQIRQSFKELEGLDIIKLVDEQ